MMLRASGQTTCPTALLLGGAPEASLEPSAATRAHVPTVRTILPRVCPDSLNGAERYQGRRVNDHLGSRPAVLGIPETEPVNRLVNEDPQPRVSRPVRVDDDPSQQLLGGLLQPFAVTLATLITLAF